MANEDQGRRGSGARLFDAAEFAGFGTRPTRRSPRRQVISRQELRRVAHAIRLEDRPWQDFVRMFSYRTAKGVKVRRFTKDYAMTEAVISLVRDRWEPQEFRI
jgi:hypothetical protein